MERRTLKRRNWWVWLLVGQTAVVSGCKRGARDEGSATAPPLDPNQPRTVAIGGSSACAALVGGAVQCWGDNSYGQLGDGGRESRLVPGVVPGLTTVVEVDVGDAHACAWHAARGLLLLDFVFGVFGSGE